MTGMTPERLAEIRARAERVAVMEVDEDRYGDRAVLLGYTRALSASADDVPELVAEVTSLWAQRDGTGDVASGTLWRAEREVSRLSNELGAQLTLRREAAQQIEKVRALHRSDGHEPDNCGQPNCFTACDECGDVYPCPTLQALDD